MKGNIVSLQNCMTTVTRALPARYIRRTPRSRASRRHGAAPNARVTHTPPTPMRGPRMSAVKPLGCWRVSIVFWRPRCVRQTTAAPLALAYVNFKPQGLRAPSPLRVAPWWGCWRGRWWARGPGQPDLPWAACTGPARRPQGRHSAAARPTHSRSLWHAPSCCHAAHLS